MFHIKKHLPQPFWLKPDLQKWICLVKMMNQGVSFLSEWRILCWTSQKPQEPYRPLVWTGFPTTVGTNYHNAMRRRRAELKAIRAQHQEELSQIPDDRCQMPQDVSITSMFVYSWFHKLLNSQYKKIKFFIFLILFNKFNIFINIFIEYFNLLQYQL